MKVLIPTDFSQTARKAADFTFSTLGDKLEKVQFVHAFDMPYYDRSFTSTLFEVIQENAENNLKSYKKELRAAGHSNFEAKTVMGSPVRIVKEELKQHHYDLLVMGTKGVNGLEEVLIGSNAASVIQNTSIPALIIPPKAAIKPFKKILLAFDMNTKGVKKALSELKMFANLYHADINVLYVQHKDGHEDGSRNFLSENLGDLFKGLTIAKTDDLEHALFEKAEKTGADCIAVITREYGFFEGLFHSSLSKKLAYHSEIPLLALHQGKEN